MYFQFGFSWPAGSWINTIGIILAKFLVSKGYYCRLDKEYSSVIKGGNNTMLLNISSEQMPFFSRTIDLFVYLDQFALDKNQNIYQMDKTCFLGTQKTEKKNMFIIGMMIAVLWFDKQEGRTFITTSFSNDHQDKNLQSFEEGYLFGEESDFSFLLEHGNTENLTLYTGNELLAKGGVNAWLGFYSAYPMTPATSIIDEIIQHPEITFFQGEDEIAVAMAMLGAKYAWKRAMCGTSGGGFALMVESLSFSIQSEIGGVYILVQRDGPSTWTPTYTAQGDLLMSLYSTFGTHSPIVLAPSTYEEYFEMVGQALNFSDQYQHPVVILCEKCLSEGYCSMNLESLTYQKNIGLLAETWDTDIFKRYQLTENGISPYSFPWRKNTLFIATSYEHDEYGANNEESQMKQQQEEKRRKKILTFQEEQFATKEFPAFEIINENATKFCITRWSNAMTLKHLVKKHSDRGLIVIKVFAPFDEALQQFLEERQANIEKILFVEMNSDGQGEKWVSEHCGLQHSSWKEKIHHYRKYSLYPIFEEEIEPLLEDQAF